MLEGMVLVEWRQMDLEQDVKSALRTAESRTTWPLSLPLSYKKKGASNFLSLTCRQYEDRLLPAELTPHLYSSRQQRDGVCYGVTRTGSDSRWRIHSPPPPQQHEPRVAACSLEGQLVLREYHKEE